MIFIYLKCNFAIILRNCLKLFEKFSCSSPLDPLGQVFFLMCSSEVFFCWSVLQEVFFLYRSPGGVNGNQNVYTIFFIFSTKSILFHWKIQAFQFLLSSEGSSPPNSCNSASLQLTMATSEIKFLCTIPMFRVNPPPKKNPPSCITPRVGYTKFVLSLRSDYLEASEELA